MLPVKKILCPTDFSQPSYRGLEAANQIARYFSAEIFLVHIIPPSHQVPGTNLAGFDITLYVQEMWKNSQKLLEGLSKDRIDSQISCQNFVIEGDPAEQIVAFAVSENVDLIVTATHGWTGWRHLVFGSVAEKVIRHAACPVLTIPKPEEKR